MKTQLQLEIPSPSGSSHYPYKGLILFLCMSLLPAYMYVHHMPTEPRRCPESLELEVLMVLDCHVGAGN